MPLRHDQRGHGVARLVGAAVIGGIGAACVQSLYPGEDRAVGLVGVEAGTRGGLGHGLAIEDDLTGVDFDLIARQANHALDPDLRGITREAKDHDLAAFRGTA